MSYHTKALAILMLMAPTAAFAVEPCKNNLSGITIISGLADPPGTLTPDTESLTPDGSLKEQGWHNLKKAHQPLKLVCRYKDGTRETFVFKSPIDKCVYTPGRVVCK
jgi:hypothetical protein